MKAIPTLTALLLASACAASAARADDAPPAAPSSIVPVLTDQDKIPHKANPESLKYWEEARFGVFITFGATTMIEKLSDYARANPGDPIRAGRPIPADIYDNLYKKLNPEKFDARQWVAIAKAAGMRYVIFTAKHCEGFLLWDSKVSDYNIMHSPFKRDMCKEIADACHEAGMKFGWYFASFDHRDLRCRTPDGRTAYIKCVQQPEIAELLTNYGKIDIMWFDGRNGTKSSDGTYALCRKLQPDILIDSRISKGKTGSGGEVDAWTDFFTPEQHVGGFDNQKSWESCMTVSARNKWAWDGNEEACKGAGVCLSMLIGCAGGDGNLLLDIGPKATGEIAPIQAATLKGMGEWLKKYGESIYATRGGPYATQGGPFMARSTIYSTRKGNTVYIHVRKWPKIGDVVLPPLPAKIKASSLLTGGNVIVTNDGKALTIKVAPQNQQEIDTLVKLELETSAMAIAPIKTSEYQEQVPVVRKKR